MSNERAKNELRTCKDILSIYNFIVKMPPFYPTKLIFKLLRNLTKGIAGRNEGGPKKLNSLMLKN